MSESIRTTACLCPHCGADLDAIRAVEDGDQPGPDAITVCIYCARISGFNPDMTVRKLTLDEWNDAMADPEVRRVVSMVKQHGARDPGRRNRRPT